MDAPQVHETPRPFSVPQLAERWGCSQGLIRKLIRAGDLPCFRPGNLIRISAAEVERYETRQQDAQPTPASTPKTHVPPSTRMERMKADQRRMSPLPSLSPKARRGA